MLTPPASRQRSSATSGFALGALLGIGMALYWRWALVALGGAAVALAAVGGVRLGMGDVARSKSLDVTLAVLPPLCFGGALLGMLAWTLGTRRAQRTSAMLGFVVGGMVLGGLVPFALVGVSPAYGLVAGFAGAILGLAFAGAAARDRPRRPETRRTATLNHDPAVEADVQALLRRLDEPATYGPGR